ncbi:MAG: FAD-dependent oxidoreductase [Christensenellales bacterium]|jgi:2,4-dienoyl-CoA reductase-like NADH-dependent reductase (Old Yellow Enzyme family)
MNVLSQPIKIGSMTVKNRMVMAPMNTNYSNENGAVTPQMTEYYAARAKGGAGLIVVEATGVDPMVRNHGAQPMIGESHISGWATMVEKLHRYDAKVAIEVVHHGSEASLGPKVSASDVSSYKGIPVKSLSVAEIANVEDMFAETVKNVKTAGFDAAVLHAAHGYLIAHFLSPLYNKRTDEYGGSLKNRMRFLIEIIEKARKAAGSDFPLIVRLSADEFIEGGRTFEETKLIAAELEKYIDAIDISASVSASYFFCIRPYSFPIRQGYLSEYTRQIKEIVSIPVITVGGIRDAERAEAIIKEGKADMVAFGRTLIADAEFCNKALSGNGRDIRQCLSCQHCLSIIDQNLPLKCTVNPEAGREFEFTEIEKANVQKKVTVVGAGPAGMEAARVAALRGHDVTLYEKSDHLGGTLRAAKMPPNKQYIGFLIDWYAKQLSDLDVNILIGTEWTAAEAQMDKPDVLIFAGGARFARVIPGSKNAVDVAEAILNPSRICGRVVIIGGGASGCEAAELLAGNRAKIEMTKVKDLSGELSYNAEIDPDVPQKDITIIEMLDDICTDMDGFNRAAMLISLKENGVKVLTSTKVIQIGENCVEIINTKTNIKQTVAADTVILAGGLVPRDLPAQPPCGVRVVSAGDCKDPGKIVDAIYQGYYLAREI